MNRLSEIDVETYDKFIGAKVCLSDELGRKMMAIVTKHMKDNEGNPRDIYPPHFCRSLII